MKRFYVKFRIMLFALALGLASVSFFTMVREKWTQVREDIPQVESAAPLVVYPVEIRRDATIAQNRDLSLYEFGGRYSYCLGKEGSAAVNCSANLEKARDFVWQNWNSKKLSYLIIDETHHLFIEPDEKGNWHIVIREVRKNYAWGDWIDEIDIRSLEWRRVDKDGNHSRVGKRRLIFVDWEDRIMFYL